MTGAVCLTANDCLAIKNYYPYLNTMKCDVKKSFAFPCTLPEQCAVNTNLTCISGLCQCQSDR